MISDIMGIINIHHNGDLVMNDYHSHCHDDEDGDYHVVLMNIHHAPCIIMVMMIMHHYNRGIIVTVMVSYSSLYPA